MSTRGHGGLLLTLCLLCAGCDGCGGKHLAELLSHEGGVDRDFAAEAEAWKLAEDGALFAEGDGLRTGPAGSAKVRVVGAGRVQLQPQTLVRFFASGRPGAEGAGAPAGVEVKAGQALIEAVEAALPLRTGTGLATVRRGSRVRVTPAERGMRFEVELGSATFLDAEGADVAVAAGQSIEVGIGLAEITDAPTGDAPAEDAPEAPAVADAGVGVGGVAATVRGQVRKRGAGEDAWAALSPGAQRVAPGTELQVDEGAEVALSRDGQRARLRQGRYEVGSAGGPLVRAADGTLSIRAEGDDTRLLVPGGVIIVRGADGGSDAEVRVHGADGRTEVSAGSGRVDTEGPAGEHSLSAGDAVELGVTADAGPGDAGRQPAEERIAWQPGLAAADFSVPAGERLQVYDPAPPVALGFDTASRCPDGAELRVGKQRWRAQPGASQINTRFNPGLHNYQVHCLRADGNVRSRPAVRGRVRVRRSRGTRALPTTAPKNTVTLDGRRYTLMYQSRLPVVTAVWPRAPSAERYTLYVRGPGGSTRQYESAQPRIELPAKALQDGNHRVYFVAVGSGGKRSKETTLAVTFDNAAPTASVSGPPPTGYAPGEEVEVRGLALAGTRVSVAGQKIALDRKQRFSGRVPAPAAGAPLAIRFQHPKHGVRYYLRRASGAGQ